LAEKIHFGGKRIDIALYETRSRVPQPGDFSTQAKKLFLNSIIGEGPNMSSIGNNHLGL
jgi:hypothetical protein